MDVFSHWARESWSAGLAHAEGGRLDVNGYFRLLEEGGGPWRWLNGPHARVRYDSLSALVLGEAATLAPAPYLSRFERGKQVFEVRLERDGPGAMALIHDVTAELRRQRELQRDREALLHEERMHAMGVLASGVAHDLNHVLNVVALRVATLRADPELAKARRTLDGLGRVVGEAARIVARLQDLARKRRDRPSDALDLAAVALEQLAPVNQRPGHRRVLMVDDEQDNLDVLREILELEGHEVAAARSGPEALVLIERGEPFDLVLCDVGMPQMSGWQVAREMRRISPSTPVWMLTGWANEIAPGDPRRNLAAGVLAKPLDLDQLRRLLSSEPPREQESLGTP